ncbi:MAG TPA: hypothetical protein VFP58_14415, partial [Candidatus Eisenbacteria bacterium]|nr:hypothetical protein [Candidatus Eisenbacteria bacterium]
MTLFAEHVPGRSGAAWIEGVTIREARAEDVPHLARIAAEREGGEPERHRAQFERFLQGVVSPDDGLLLVA